MQIDLHNFFKFYDEKNPNHVKAIQILEDTLPDIFLKDNVEWVKVYRTRVEPPKSNILPNFPWFPQTDNFRDQNRTCNSSSCAMCLEYFKPGTLKGPKGDNDYIRKVFAIGDTIDHAVQTRVLQSYGIQSTFRYNLTFADLDRELSAGRPICIGILHRGSLSAPTGGHILVVIGKSLDGKSYICNDPYGSLNNGYSGPVTQGKEVHYSVDVLRRRWCPKGNDGWGRIFEPVKK